MIENLINGNLKDAKRQARRFSQDRIQRYLMVLGWTEAKAHLGAIYLKTGTQEAWNEYCHCDR